MKTVVGLFNDVGEAKGTIGDFARIGLSPEQIGLLSSSQSAAGMSPFELPGFGRVAANGPMMNLLRDPDGLASALVKMGIAKGDVGRCIDTIKRGGTLEAVMIEDAKEADALAIMRRHTAPEPRAVQREPRGLDRDRDYVIPIVAEEIEVGKREIDAGGVRVATHVSSVPVEKTVSVREEHVTVERRTVDRPIDERDDAFRDHSVEMKATAEEPIVAKRARIVEEIRIHKDTTEHVETVHDKIRRTDVKVTDIPAADLRIRRRD